MDAAMLDRFPFLRGLDPAKPDSVVDGRSTWSVRCRVPFDAPAGVASIVTGQAARDTLQAQRAERVISDSGDGVVVSPEATGDPGDNDEVPWDEPLVMGIASSTSVDFYGTEMSLRALKTMAAQMMAGTDARTGVPYVPMHSNAAGGPMEWNDVIGRTVHAEVIPQDEVKRAFNVTEQQFILRTTIRLYKDEPMAQAMIRRLQRGELIGQSIGGWFTQLEVVQNAEGEVERVIVLGVELDHLAATRAPANPDSNEVTALRSALVDRLRAAPQVAQRMADAVRAESDAPNYRVSVEGAGTCATCKHFAAGQCALYAFAAEPTYTCDTFVAGEVTQACGPKKKARAEGEPPCACDPAATSCECDPEGGCDCYEEEEPEPAVEVEIEVNDGCGDKKSSVPSSVSGVVDTEQPAGDHTGKSASDARGSASPVNEARSDADQPEQEPTMPTDDTANIAALSALLDSKLAPLAERMTKLESNGAATQQTSTPEQRAAAADERAKLAEAKLAQVLAQPNRVGRTQGPVTTGVGAPTGLRSLIERARETSRSGPCATAIASERMIDAVTCQPGKAPANLRDHLASLLDAAVADGLLTNPADRASWA